MLLGIVEREGELRTMHVADGKARTLQGEVRKNVAPGSTMMTDEDRAFVGLDRDYWHHAVNHSAANTFATRPSTRTPSKACGRY